MMVRGEPGALADDLSFRARLRETINHLLPPVTQLLPGPVDARRIGPQVFQTIVGARVGIEHMDHDVAVVLHHPFAGLVAFDGGALLAGSAQGGVHFLRERMDLPAAGAGT